MSVFPQVRLQVSLGGGAFASGVLQGAFSQTFAQQLVSTAGLYSLKYEIYDFPPGMTVPSGWSTDSVTGAYYYAPANVTTPPPSGTLPVSGKNNWGRFMLRARGNGNPLAQNADGSPNANFNPNLTDESTLIFVPSPLAAMPGVGFNEAIQADSMRGWLGPLMQCLRDLEAAITGSSGAIAWSQSLPIVGPTTPQTIGATAPSRIPVSGTGGAFQLNLPSSPNDGDYYFTADVAGTVSLTNSVTISGNGHNIMGNTEVILTNAWDRIALVFKATQNVWVLAS